MFWNSRFMTPKVQKEKTNKGGDPEYEEIGPQRNHKESQNDIKNDTSSHCDLCGSSDAEVRCDKCNFQAFCPACDETYHGHPKRANHTRKALKEEVNHGRPPLPSKIPDGGTGPTPAAPPPQPPPRRNKKGLILSSTFGTKDQNDNETGRTLMGSLKKIMGGRPLPPPPDQNLDKRRNSTPNISHTNNIAKSSPVNNYDGNDKVTVALPQSIIDINSKATLRKPPSSMPPTPPSAAQQYPKIQPKGPPVIPGRKFSLQQFPSNFEDKRASLVDGTTPVNNAWDKQQSQHPHQQHQQQQTQQQEMHKLRSQSVSDDQWHQMIALHGSHPPQGFTGSTAASEVGGIGLPRRPYNTLSGAIRPFGRGMVSSASVCDLNTLNQQQHQQQQQQLHQPGAYPSIHSANSFQQLSVMSYDPNMVWVQPSPCTLCQTPQMFSHTGMKRTTSNISMNLSSVGSDITGYPWPHVHHHMPMGYPGYYPGCHPHMIPPGYTQGSAMSIPDSMKSYNRRPTSPAPSARSSSHRSHKSSKSRSFNVDAGRRSRNHSRKRSEESEESESSSISDDRNLPVTTKSSKPGGLAWQCDHCTFINPGHVQSCGMCSKVPGKSNGRTSRRGNDRRKSDKRRDKRTDSGENVHNVSDYENDKKKELRRDNRLKSSGSVKSSSGRSKKKSRRRESSPSHSSSGSGSDDEDEEAQVETQLRDLRITSRSRAGEYDGFSVTSRTREKEKERGSLKKEGGGSRYRNRRRFHSDRSMTPARSSPSRRSRKASINSDEKSSNGNKSSANDLDEIIPQENKSSHEGTLVGTTASESNTLKKISTKENSREEPKENAGSLKHWKANQSLNKKNMSHSEKTESQESSELEDPFDPPKEASESDKEENINIKESPIRREELSPSKEKVKDVAESDQDENRSIKEKEYEKPDDKLYQGHLAPLNAKVYVDVPSFANTLDGIETLGTNEIADYEPSQALEYKIEDSEQILQDLNNLLPEVNAPINKIENNEYDLYEKSDHEKENIKEEILYLKENEIKDEKGEKEVINLSSPNDTSYEVIDNPMEKEVIEHTHKIESRSNDGQEKNMTNTIKDDQEDNATESESNEDETSDKDNELPPPGNEKELTEEVLESLSSENSNEVLAPRRDRQHTPLSISSSDVQFYSPPNSPDLSLNEKLHGKRIANEHQQIARPSVDDDLGTALATAQRMREQCSSKDTFQSSYEQLSEEMYDDDSSEEEEEEEEKEETAKPSPVTLTLPPEGETKQGYSSFVFPKSQPQSISIAKKSASDQDLSSRNHPNEEKNEKATKITKPRRIIEREVVFSDEEDEVDEKFLTVEELIKRRRQKAMKEQGLQLVQILREAEEKGYNPEEVSVAISLCEKNKSPVEWLQENWRHMVDTVMALASTYGIERSSNKIGEITSTEAKKALRVHKGNIWEAVTSCVEERQKKYDDLVSRGNFKREDVIRSLTDNQGDVEKAFLELNKPYQLGTFFSKIWEGLMESMPRVIPERSKADVENKGEKKEKILTFQELKKEKQIKQVKKERKSRRKKVEAPTTKTETEGENAKSTEAEFYADVDDLNSTNRIDEETENEIYENFVNPLLEKLGDSLPKREDGNPLISEELKRKIVQAILEGDTGPTNENVVFDSDEESTIEELLAVAENPTFYDYFTAVDLEDFEEISDDEGVKEDNEASTSSYDSPGIVSEEEKEGGAKVYEEGPLLTEEVQSDFEYFDEFKSVDNPTTDEESEEEIDDQNEEVQFIREEDVVVHPLKAFSHYAKLSKAQYTEEGDAHAGGSHSNRPELKVSGGEKRERTPARSAGPTGVSATAYRNASTFMQSMKWFFSLERKVDQNKDEKQASAKQENEPKRPETVLEVGKEEQDDEKEEDEDDETEKESQPDEENIEEDNENDSVSITTGSLNLALTQTPDQEANIGMKSHTVQTGQSSVQKNTAQPSADHNIKNEPNQAVEKEVRKVEKPPEEKPSISPPSLPPNEAKSIQPRSGPVTVQKATLILGKAISKAMARESSVRRDSIPSDSASEKGSVSPASTPESEELPEIAPIGNKLTKPQSSESRHSGSITAPLSPEPAAAITASASATTASASATTASASATTASANAKSLSIPPAVASYSGPIFIPSSSAAVSKTVSDYSNPSHTYYNEPLKVEGSSSASQKDGSTHYETIREALKPNADVRNNNDAKPQIASAASLPPTISDRPLAKDQKQKTPVNDKEALPTSSPKSIRVKPSTTEDKIQIKPSTSKESDSPLNQAKFKPGSPKHTKEIKQAKNAKTANLLPKSQNNSSKPKKIGSDADAHEGSPSKPEVKDGRTSEGQEENQESSTKRDAQKPSVVPKTKTSGKDRPKMGSSGETEEEEEEEQEKIETELDKVENLKNRKGAEVGDKEVQELKEQILMMRKELEENVDSDDSNDSNRSSTLKGVESPADPLVLQAPEATAEKEEGEAEEEESVKEEAEEEERGKEENEETTHEEDKQQYEQLKFDRTVRRLLAEGQATTYEKAELAAQLLTLSFDETDSIQAAEGCSSIYTALQFLQQECELCAEKYPMGRMVSMLHCVHRCCYDCANTYFSFQVKTKNIRELRCPFCNEPDLDASEEIAAEYLNNLDILLKNILDLETHELFQRKLRDWTLMKDPNFRWCNKCSSGFIANPRARKLICPDCKDVTCAQCRKEWEAQHTGISCEVFAQWKEENEPEAQQESVAKHLAENGITCPNCRFTYSLAKGGCMHFTCTECKHEFCSGCSQPFRQGAKCHVGPYCERLGLHSHHPRNCLFYLRDKEPGQLQQLLKEHNIEYDTETSPDTDHSKKVCRVQEQKETMEGLRDDICGRITQNGYAGLCRLHYIEYLVEKINNHGLDPVSIFDEADLRVCLRRNGKTVPVRRWESEKLYRDKLIKLIKEQLPLT